jgi:hypothetical protein
MSALGMTVRDRLDLAARLVNEDRIGVARFTNAVSAWVIDGASVLGERVWSQEGRTCPGVMAVGVLRARRYSGSYPERSVGEASPIRSVRPSIGLHPVGCAQPKDRPSQRHNSSIVTP